MKRLEFLHQAPTTQHPEGPASINGHVYELTYQEVEWLEKMNNAKNNDYFRFLDGRLIRVGNALITGNTDYEIESLIKNLKDNIKELKELRDSLDDVFVLPEDRVQDIVLLSREINVTADNLLRAYKLAGITQSEE